MIVQVPPPTTPTVTQVPPDQLDNLAGFLDNALNGMLDPAPILAIGLDLWTGLASIIVVWTGLRIAYSGDFKAWELVRLVFGIGIPLWMLEFYTAPLPGMTLSFPRTITGGGDFIANLVSADIGQVMFDALRDIWSDMTNRVSGTNFNILRLGSVIYELLMQLTIVPLLLVAFTLIFAVSYAQVLWAKIAIALLIFLGPIFIPWLVFQPMAFLFWGWFKSMWTFTLYSVLAHAMLRLWGALGLNYLESLNQAVQNGELHLVSNIGLHTIFLMIAALLATLKIGSLANMLVTGSGAPSSGLLGMIGTATMGAAGASKLITATGPSRALRGGG